MHKGPTGKQQKVALLPAGKKCHIEQKHTHFRAAENGNVLIAN